MNADLAKIYERVDDYLLMHDKSIIKLLCAFAIACRMPIIPPWLFLVGGSSTGKALLPDHEVLTKDGWKFIGDIKKGEQVMAWDLPDSQAKNGKLVYAEVQGVFEQDHDGDIYESSSQRAYFKASPDHRWYISTSHDNNNTRGSHWRVVRSSDLPRGVNIPATGLPIKMPNNNFSAEELELMGWYIAEGCRIKKKPHMVEIPQVKPSGRDRLEYLFNKLNLKYYKYAKTFHVVWTPLFPCGDNCYEKFIPRELMFEQNRQGLLDGLIAGDGSIFKNKDKFKERESWEYYSASRQLIDDVQELAMGLGWRTSISPKPVTYKYRNANDASIRPKNGKGMFPGHYVKNWRLYACDRPKWNLGKLETKHYKGKTYCLWVPGPGTFIARYKGTPFVTGNSQLLLLLEGVPGNTPVDDMTGNTLLSGMKKFDGSPSLLDQLPVNGGFLMFSDFTVMLSKNPEELSKILGQLRVVFDGKFTKRTGGQVDKAAWEGKAGLLAACTTDLYYKTEEYAEVGQRMVICHLPQPSNQEVGKWKFSHGKDDRKAIRKDIQAMMADYIANVPVPKEASDLPDFDAQTEQDIIDIADLAVTARSPVGREKYSREKEQTGKRDPEGIGRVQEQLMTIAYGLMVQNEGSIITPEDRKILYGIALDCIELNKRSALKALTEFAYGGDADQIADVMELGKAGAERHLEDLRTVGLLEKRKSLIQRGKPTYVLKDRWRDIMSRFENIEIKNEEMKSPASDDVMDYM